MTMGYEKKAEDVRNPDGVWKNIYHNVLVEVEEDEMEQHFRLEELLRRLPTFSLKKSLGCLVGAAVMFSFLSWCMRSADGNCAWWSGLFLNLAMGMVSGVVLLCYSNRQQGVVAGYGAVVLVLRERLNAFRVAESGLFDPLFAFQTQRNLDLGVAWMHVHINFIWTMKSHLKYLHKMLDGKVELGIAQIIERIESRLAGLEGVERRIHEVHSEECLRKACSDVWELERFVLTNYEKLINTLQMKIYAQQFGKNVCQQSRDVRDDDRPAHNKRDD